MAKTMRRIVIAAILLILLAGVAVFALYNCSAGTPLEGARTATLNTVIEQTGVKDRIENKLSSKANEIAEEYGLPVEFLDAGIDMLDVKDWKVVDTPANATVEKTVEMDVGGSPVQITTYDDKSVISIKGEGDLSTYGQTITFELPESAQGAADLLPYLDAAEEIGVGDLIGSLVPSTDSSADAA